MTPEAALLLACARTRMDDAHAAKIENSVSGNFDWNRIEALSRAHAVMPLLYRSLADVCPDRVPGPVLERLRDEFDRNAKRNLEKTGELLRLLDLLTERGVQAVPYKGPVMASSAYGNLAYRQFIDLDLLVHRRDVAAAVAALEEDGYRRRARPSPRQNERLLRNGYEEAVVRADGSIVEIQWDVAPRYFSAEFDLSAAWGRLATVRIGGRDVETLSPEDLLPVLCIHGAKHEWERLGWVCDVAELLRVTEDADWGPVIARASRCGIRRMVLLGPALAASLLGSELPPEVGDAVRAESRLTEIVSAIGRRLLDSRPARRDGFPFRPLHLRMRERFRDRARYVWRLAVTPTEGDWEAVSLPPPLDPLYHVIRPVRLAARYGAWALGRK